MHYADLEDLTLWLVYAADEKPDWPAYWAAAYPAVCISEIGGAPETWARQLVPPEGKNIAVAAYGKGAAAFAQWLFHADILRRKSLKNIILVSPPAALADGWCADALRASCPCRAALVIGSGNSAAYEQQTAEWAKKWRAKRLTAPEAGRLQNIAGGWEWGMKLMQEMLLSD